MKVLNNSMALAAKEKLGMYDGFNLGFSIGGFFY